MCGIAGFFANEMPELQAKQYLKRMLRAIEHRGPDGEGTWSDAALGLHLGMRRLSIIDLVGGQQPIWNEDRTLAVFFNGEIYNYLELRRDLEGAGHVFSTHSDTEVLVHLYERDGEKMFAALRGMFALALFDTRNRKLLVARDEAGQKPFFYYRDEHRFAFASEIKSLLTLPFVPDDFSPDALLHYSAWLSLPAPYTHFKHIHKLPPGSFLRIDLSAPAAAEVRRFSAEHKLDLGSVITDPNEAVERLDAALEESVRLHLRADVPVGILLSSGLDSQTIAAYVQAIQPGKLSTFTAVFDDRDSEQEGAEASARMIGSTHYNVPLTVDDLTNSLPDIAWFLDEPIADPAAFAVYKVCQFARQHVKVVLGGEGSDERFAGYAGRYRGILATLERSNRIRRWAGWLPKSLPQSTANPLGRLLRRAHLTEAEEAILLRVEGFPGDIRSPMGLSPQQFLGIEKFASVVSSTVYDNNLSPLERLLRLDCAWQLPESLLVKADRMSMAASIELRSPFLDSKIKKLADRVSMDLKLPPTGAGKWVLHKCLQRRYPNAVPREKKGFPIPLAVWLRGSLRARVEEVIFSSHSASLSCFDPARLRAAWQCFLDGANLASPFYALWLYETWKQEFQSRIRKLRTDV
jgi:asparagine synthase (glutamine-hydrolysing)